MPFDDDDDDDDADLYPYCVNSVEVSEFFGPDDLLFSPSVWFRLVHSFAKM